MSIMNIQDINTMDSKKMVAEMLFSVIRDVNTGTLLQGEHRLMGSIIAGGSLLISIILLVFIFLLLMKLKKLKEKNDATRRFNELSKTFMDADERLIYLKDENLKYIFCNKALERFYNKDASEITGKDDFALTDKQFAELQRKSDLDVLEQKAVRVDEIKWGGRIYKTIKFPVRLLNSNSSYGVGAYIEDVTGASNRKREREKTLLRNAILVDVFTQNFHTSRDQLDYVLSKALELTESKFGYIYLYNEENREFILNSWSPNVLDECTISQKQTRYQLEKTGVWGEVVRQRKPIVINDFEKPDTMKKGYPPGHVKLVKYMSVPVIIDDRIVAVVGLANKKADYDANDIYQVTVLMTGVWNARERREREIELEKTNAALKESNDKLQAILDSAAEAIYGTDKNGNCTFCNASCLKMLGYKHQDELIGKNMHLQIHHSYRDGRPLPIEECRLNKAFRNGESIHTEDEVFWRADGTCFDIECFSYPQYKDGEVIGNVVTFMDITERKKAENYIRYLSYHDSLTGLYNRMFFEEEIKRLDTARNLPISIIAGDVNGLKLTNDVFGHAAGDRLLQKIAEVFKRVCRADDIIARVGGDEFLMLLPRTRKEDARKIISRIRKEFSNECIVAVKGSISMGCDTKVDVYQDIYSILKNAEDEMYLEKTLHRKSINSNLIKTIIETLHAKSPREKVHSQNVRAICLGMGRAMNLSGEEIRRLKEAGFLHDIGKITLDEKQLNEYNMLDGCESGEMNNHPVIGYRILNFFDETLDLAEAVLAHHEHWDGSGYPKGLQGEEIPKLARVIAVAENFDAMTNEWNPKPLGEKDALRRIREQAGTKFDPDVVEVFVKMMLAKGDE